MWAHRQPHTESYVPATRFFDVYYGFHSLRAQGSMNYLSLWLTFSLKVGHHLKGMFTFAGHEERVYAPYILIAHPHILDNNGHMYPVSKLA